MAKGIFCLETEWDFKAHKLKEEATIEPMLEFMKHVHKMKYVHRRVATRADLSFYLKQLKKGTFNNFEIVYLSFHGNTQQIILEGEKRNPVTLAELAELAQDAFKDKFVHFSSCRTFLGSEYNLEYFKRETGAKLVSGYTRSVDFTLSSLMDIAYFNEINKTSIKFNTVVNRIDKLLAGLKSELGFKIL